MTEFRELSERYQLKKILRSTRFGSVLRAIDTSTGQAVAIKLIPVASQERLQEGEPFFARLTSALQALRHPNLPLVADSGFTSDGSAFLALEWLEGEPVSAAGEVATGRAVAWVLRALNGLEVLAARGLAHHNLATENLFLAASPEGGAIKLLGLGSALFRPTGLAMQAGWPPESVRFQAPEFGLAPRNDARVDIYALARIACELLGATIPPGDDPAVQLPLAVSFELENELALRRVLEGALRRDPASRPGPRELREALQTAVTGMSAQPEVNPLDGTMADLATPSFLDAGPPSDDLLPIFESLLTVEPAPPKAPAAPPAAQATPSPYVPPAPPAAPPIAQVTSLPDLPPPPPPAVPPAAPVGEEPTGEPGDVLSAIDDEVLNALLAVPPPIDPRAPDAKRAKGTTASMAKVVPFSPRPAPQARAAVPSRPDGPSALRLLRKPAVFGGLAGGLVLAGLATYWVFLRGGSEPPAPAAPQVQLPPPPTEPPLAQLEEAELQLAQGNDFAARKILQGLSFAEQGLLPPERCRELAALEAVLSASGLAQLPVDLAKGLESGDLRRLLQAVGTAEEQGRSLVLETAAQQNLERAREVVKSYGQAQAAAAKGAYSEVLQSIAALRKALPKLEDPEKLRDKAAAALEGEAAALSREARYDEARAKLELIRSAWPERPGLGAGITALDTYKKNEAEQTKMLAGMNAYERRRKPHEGLEALAAIEPTPHLAPQFKTARQRLEDQLSRLDQKPPQVVLRDGYYLEFQRGAVVELSFRATDDYMVKGVRMMARTKGGSFREVKLAKSTFGYTAQLTPAFHRNAEVQFYVTATDLSGHEGYYGTPSEPILVKPQRGFERILR